MLIASDTYALPSRGSYPIGPSRQLVHSHRTWAPTQLVPPPQSTLWCNAIRQPTLMGRSRATNHNVTYCPVHPKMLVSHRLPTCSSECQSQGGRHTFNANSAVMQPRSLSSYGAMHWSGQPVPMWLQSSAQEQGCIRIYVYTYIYTIYTCTIYILYILFTYTIYTIYICTIRMYICIYNEHSRSGPHPLPKFWHIHHICGVTSSH